VQERVRRAITLLFAPSGSLSFEVSVFLVGCLEKSLKLKRFESVLLRYKTSHLNLVVYSECSSSGGGMESCDHELFTSVDCIDASRVITSCSYLQ